MLRCIGVMVLLSKNNNHKTKRSFEAYEEAITKIIILIVIITVSKHGAGIEIQCALSVLVLGNY